jgi:hypothetical protein
MDNVVRDPKVHPDAIIPDMSKADPLITFTKDDIAFVYGSKWKQRYFTKVGDDYFPLGAQWDVTHKRWSRYLVADNTDWWVPRYPRDNAKRPTGPLCDGCHSIGYDVQTKRVAEWNWAAKSVTVPDAIMRPAPRERTSSTRRASIRCTPTTPVSSATRRDSRSRTRLRGSTTTGRWASASA